MSLAKLKLFFHVAIFQFANCKRLPPSTYQARWMLYFRENPIETDDLGVPLSQETPIFSSTEPLFSCVERGKQQDICISDWHRLAGKFQEKMYGQEFHARTDTH